MPQNTLDWLIAGLPFLTALAGIIYRFGHGWIQAHVLLPSEQRLPANVYATLQDLAPTVVQGIEQELAGLSGVQKKGAAIQGIKGILEDLDLPLPGSDAINHAIEAAVFALNQEKQATPTSKPAQ